MSATQLKRLAGVLAAALAIWAVLALTRRAPGDAPVGLTLPKIDTAAVDTIAIIQGPDSAIVTRHTDGPWRVNGYPAAHATVEELLHALADSTNRSELTAESRSSHAALGVSADSGRRMRVVAGRGAGLDLIAGHHTGDYRGRYVCLAGDSAVYAMHGPLAQALAHALSDWRDKTIVSIAPRSVERVELDHGRRSYAVVRSGASWRFASGGSADSAAVQQWLKHFHPMSASGFATAAQAGAAHLAHPTVRVRLFGAAQRPLADLRFDSTASRVWVRADTGKTVYALERWMLSAVAPPARTLAPSAAKAKGTAR